MLIVIIALSLVCLLNAQPTDLRVGGPRDPGVRPGPASAGTPVPGLTADELAAFNEGLTAFQEVDGVAEGLGPRFNLDSCAGCHQAPAVGGSSPAMNPQVAMATKSGANNRLPPFVTLDGPVVEVRVKKNPDGTPHGGVRALFTIQGRADARGCRVDPSDFSNPSNLSLRIPTPTFGLGLIEAISDRTLRDNLQSDRFTKQRLGISGHLNTSGNDGTVTRFGWKAQNKSLVIFAAEAYNVEQGITNEAFPTEREEDSDCTFTTAPEDGFTMVDKTDIIEFANFMRFLNAPAPAALTASTANGRNLFDSVGCTACHTPTLTTSNSACEALRRKPATLYSDLAVHNMGSGLADGISQGSAGPDEFRTAPLWGLGQRIFFLHDGRTKDLHQAIQAHSSAGSEANNVIGQFNALSVSDRQAILDFLRSL